MAPSPRKGGPQAYPSDLVFQTLRNCLVNLPQALVNVLVQHNKVRLFRLALTRLLTPSVARSECDSRAHILSNTTKDIPVQD